MDDLLRVLNNKNSLDLEGGIQVRSILRTHVISDALNDTLSPDEREFYLMLRAHVQKGVSTFTQNTIARLSDLSQSSVSRKFKILRIKRVVTLQQIRGFQTENRYSLHESPLTLAQVAKMDDSYFTFIVQSTRSGTKKLRLLAKSELDKIPMEYLKNVPVELIGDVHNCENEQNPNYATVHKCEIEQNPNYATVHKCENGGDTGDKYIYARTQIGINNYVINKSIYQSDGECEGKIFSFFEKPEIQKLVDLVKGKFQNHTTHAVLNRLKKQSYVAKDGEQFRHTVSQSEAEVILLHLVEQRVHSPLKYVDALLYQAHLGQLCLNETQARFLAEIQFGDEERAAEAERLAQQKSAEEAESEAIHEFWRGKELAVGQLLVDKAGNDYEIDPVGNLRPLDQTKKSADVMGQGDYFISAEKAKALIYREVLTWK